MVQRKSFLGVLAVVLIVLLLVWLTGIMLGSLGMDIHWTGFKH